MGSIASRDLRNRTAEVLRRVREGETVLITVHRDPVAQIGPVAARRRQSMPRHELAALLADRQADAGLRGQLAELVGESTDDLEPPR
jgi:prevent-host-death family protein